MVKEIRFCKFKRLVVWTKGNSVPERAFSGTEYARGAKNRLPVVRGAFSEALGAQNRLFWYGRDIRYRKPPPMVRGTSSFGGTRYRKRPPVVRGAFPEAFGAQNRLLWYGRDIRYRKRPPTVRGASSERITKKGMQKNCTPIINSPRQSNHNYLISIRRVA